MESTRLLQLRETLDRYKISAPSFNCNNLFEHNLEERYRMYKFLEKLRDILMLQTVGSNYTIKENKIDLWGNGVWHLSSLISLYIAESERKNANKDDILTDIVLRHFNFIAQVISNRDEIFKIHYAYMQTPFEKTCICEMLWDIPDEFQKYLILIHDKITKAIRDDSISTEKKVC